MYHSGAEMFVEAAACTEQVSNVFRSMYVWRAVVFVYTWCWGYFVFHIEPYRFTPSDCLLSSRALSRLCRGGMPKVHDAINECNIQQKWWEPSHWMFAWCQPRVTRKYCLRSDKLSETCHSIEQSPSSESSVCYNLANRKECVMPKGT